MNAKSIRDIDKSIGEKVNKLRLNKGITRQELAKEIGVTHQQLQKYIIGTNRISVSRIIDIAKTLESPVTYFFEDCVDDEGIQSIISEQEAITIMKDFAKMRKKSHRDMITKLLKTFLEDEKIDRNSNAIDSIRLVNNNV